MPREILVGGDRIIKMSKKDNKHAYYYCVGRFYDGELLHIGGYITAKDEDDAIRKVLIREVIEEEIGDEFFLELREII